MPSFRFTGKLPEHWEGDIFGTLSQAAGWRAVRVNEQQPDGIFHATIEHLRHTDFDDVRSAIEELGIEILGE